MNAKKILAIGLLVTLSASYVMAQGGLTTTNTTFNKAAFEQSLISAVGPNVMGYQFVLIKDGKIVSEKAGGNARNAADGPGNQPVGMTNLTPINIGSLQKFITGTTLLNLMENPAVYTPDRNQSLAVRLNRKMSTLFPNVWTKNMESGVENITLRQLLQHRSGFDNSYDGDRNVMGFIKAGFNPAQFDKREYSNINFVLTGYLIPLYERPERAKLLDISIGEAKLADGAADNYVKNELGKQMSTIFHQRVWDKMSPKFSPSCNAKVEYKDTAAKGYNSKSDTSSGVLTSQIEKKGHCSGEGGYYMSARDYANYIAHFSVTNLIVSKEGRDLMYTEGMNPNDRLVWAGATDQNWKHYNWFEKNFKMGTVVWSAGGTDGTNGVLLRLPQNYYLVLLVNSNDFKVNELFNFGAEAFMSATQQNFK